ncbi:MAG: hypothetical protein Q7S31_03670 [bacterium]|nr:hypothetical protein [bacterium]
MKRREIDLDVVRQKYYIDCLSQDQIAKQLNVSQWVISNRINVAGLERLSRTRKLNPRKYSINHYAFDHLNGKTSWLLGWMASDGFVRPNSRLGLKVAAKDRDIVLKFKQHLSHSGPIYNKVQRLESMKKDYKLVSIEVSSSRIAQKMADFGIIPNKSLVLTYPLLIARSDENIERSFIRGVFEGDGSILIEKERSLLFQIVGTYKLCLGVQQALIRYVKVGETKLTNNIRGRNHYALRYRGRYQVLKIVNWIYKNAGKNVLNRKYSKYLELKRKFS